MLMQIMVTLIKNDCYLAFIPCRKRVLKDEICCARRVRVEPLLFVARALSVQACIATCGSSPGGSPTNLDEFRSTHLFTTRCAFCSSEGAKLATLFVLSTLCCQNLVNILFLKNPKEKQKNTKCKMEKS